MSAQEAKLAPLLHVDTGPAGGNACERWPIPCRSAAHLPADEFVATSFHPPVSFRTGRALFSVASSHIIREEKSTIFCLLNLTGSPGQRLGRRRVKGRKMVQIDCLRVFALMMMDKS